RAWIATSGCRGTRALQSVTKAMPTWQERRVPMAAMDKDSTPVRILVVDDDKRLQRDPPHLVVLDLMLPGEDGLAVCRRLRGSGERVPIIMLTAKGED